MEIWGLGGKRSRKRFAKAKACCATNLFFGTNHFISMETGVGGDEESY